MCRASEAFKTEFLKNGYKNIWTKNSNLTLKNMHNVGLKIENFELLAVASQFKLKKKNANFFFQLFLFHTKKFPWFPDWKTSLTLIFCQTMVELCPFITSCF